MPGPLGVRLDIAGGPHLPMGHSVDHRAVSAAGPLVPGALPAGGVMGEGGGWMVPEGNSQRRYAWGSGMSRARSGVGDLACVCFYLLWL